MNFLSLQEASAFGWAELFGVVFYGFKDRVYGFVVNRVDVAFALGFEGDEVAVEEWL
jgi:hypothetical protein